MVITHTRFRNDKGALVFAHKFVVAFRNRVESDIAVELCGEIEVRIEVVRCARFYFNESRIFVVEFLCFIIVIIVVFVEHHRKLRVQTDGKRVIEQHDIGAAEDHLRIAETELIGDIAMIVRSLFDIHHIGLNTAVPIADRRFDHIRAE